jgi:hypothetical protein
MPSIQIIDYTQALKLITKFPVSIQPKLKDIVETLHDAWQSCHVTPELGLIRGDVEADAFELPGSFDMVFILGNVTVGKFIRDTGPSDYSLLAVSGDVKADAVISLCSMVVGGSVQARCVYANSLNDGQLQVGGDINADELFIETGQYTQCGGRLQSPLIISTHNEIHAADGIHGQYFEHSDKDFLHYFLDELVESKPEIDFDGTTWVTTGKIVHSINDDALVAALQTSQKALKASI